MINLQNADSVLKDVYLGFVSNQINTKTNPLYRRIKKSTQNIEGNTVRVLAPYGLYGGIVAGEEYAEVPSQKLENQYLVFQDTLKNLYGRFDITDKAIKASAHDAGAFVNLLQNSMKRLIEGCTYGLSRMLYGDGNGTLGTLTVTDGKYYIDKPNALVPGMFVDMYRATDFTGITMFIKGVNKLTKEVSFVGNTKNLKSGDIFRFRGGYGNEIMGLKGLVNASSIYGNSRATYPTLNATKYEAATSDAFDEEYVQKVLDDLEENGTVVNFINCSYPLKRLYQKYLTIYKKNVEWDTLEDGTKVITHCGVPIVPTNFVDDGECYFLNTDDFTFYELGDWSWIQGPSGSILQKEANYTSFSATLAKYTQLICQKPNGVGYVSGLSTTVPEPSTESGSTGTGTGANNTESGNS